MADTPGMKEVNGYWSVLVFVVGLFVGASAMMSVDLGGDGSRMCVCVMVVMAEV